jgi:hypothetical protein
MAEYFKPENMHREGVNMQVKLRDVKGLMVDSKQSVFENNNRTMDKKGNIISESSNVMFDRNAEGFNEALTQQGSRAVTLNRDRLAMRMWAYEFLVSGVTDIKYHWDMAHEFMQEKYLSKADAILADLPNLLESVD